MGKKNNKMNYNGHNPTICDFVHNEMYKGKSIHKANTFVYDAKVQQ